MSVYAYANILKMERTTRVTCSATALVADAITIPTITVSGKTIRPIGLAIIDASADFNLLTGTAASLGTAVGIIAADLAADNMLSLDLGESDIIVLSDGAGTATVDIRWFWPNQARQGSALGTFDHVNIPTMTADLTAVTAEAVVSIPAGAVQLVINDLSADGLLYRVDDGVVNGQQVTVLNAHVSYDRPYIIHVNDGDRLRIQRSSASDVDLVAYWKIG